MPVTPGEKLYGLYHAARSKQPRTWDPPEWWALSGEQREAYEFTAAAFTVLIIAQHPHPAVRGRQKLGAVVDDLATLTR